MENQYWQAFYTAPDEQVSNCSMFARAVSHSLRPGMAVLDLGCGNARDARHFAGAGCRVVGLDTAVVEDEHSGDNLTCVRANAFDYLGSCKNKFDVVYLRWFLHALPYDQQFSILKEISKVLAPGGRVLAETRSLNDKVLLSQSTYDEKDRSYATSHKRWPTTTKALIAMAHEHGYAITYVEERNEFSQNGDRNYNNDPVLIRMYCNLDPSNSK